MCRQTGVFGLIVLALTASAQDAPQRLEFEVASIKLSKPGSTPNLEFLPGGGLRANLPLGFLLQAAYRVKPFQIVGAPAWVDSESYTIEAKAPAGATSPDKAKAMEQTLERFLTLLVERCRMIVRREPREMPVYALTIDKNGHRLKEGSGEFRLRLAKGRIRNEGGAAVAMLVSLLSNNLDKVVIDKTGLTGKYAFDLQWTPDPPLSATPRPDELPGPSLFTAMQEQLGLKLEAQKGPVETIVIERIEKPTEN